LPDRWSYYGEDDLNYNSDSSMKNWKCYRLNYEDKTVTNKATAQISFAHKDNVNFIFDSNDELYEFLNKVRELSKETFITVEQ
jgi:hypothetical protein